MHILLQYVAVAAAIHFFWEVLQLPLYTIWTGASLQQQAFAVVHCTAGDALISGASMLSALALAGRPAWPASGTTRVNCACLAFGLAYTVFSEWLNTSVRATWTYSELMPTVPVLGTGVAPLLQWIAVPLLAQTIVIGWPQSADRRKGT